MEEDTCPDCGNEIYKPYTYCNACGWEKGEEEEEEKEEKKGKKAKKDKKAKGKKEPKEEKKKETKPLKIKCKCGATIKVKSSKRPIKVECPECGRTGTIKEPAKPEKEKISEPEKEKLKKSKGKEEKRKGKKPQEKSAKKSKERAEEDKKRKKGKVPGPADPKTPKTKDRMRRKVEDTDEDYCPECGTRLAVTGVCPNCGYRAGPGRAYKAPDDVKHKKGKKHKPPKGARSVKPKKGICSKCNSKKLRFYDDGSGRCSDCGREFRWDGGASRVQEDEYECPKCGELLEWIEDYQRWYCYKCEKYQ